MIAVIFEVWPDPNKKQNYLDLAQELKSELQKIDGFISVERFESIHEPGKMLSLSFFRDEAAIAEWRNTAMHRNAQALGRGSYFQNYRLRIAEVARDYGKDDRAQVPDDSKRVHGEEEG